MQVSKFEMNILVDVVIQKDIETICKLESLLKIRDTSLWTLAHHLAFKGLMFPLPQCKDIVKMTDSYGRTVAHWMAMNGYVFDIEQYPDIVRLTDKYGESVIKIMQEVSDYNVDLEKFPDLLEYLK